LFMPGPAWTMDPPIYASSEVGMTGARHHTQPFYR
jgi:hypothetical protein